MATYLTNTSKNVMTAKQTFKKDKYRKVRGNYSRWLQIICENCKSDLLIYQKDGPGMLKRLYLDRITSPESLSDLQKEDIKNIHGLVCTKCKTLIGVPFIYEKENRPAFRLFVGAVEKKIIRQNTNKSV